MDYFVKAYFEKEVFLKDKVTAGLLAFFFGPFGAQHFYLGDERKGVTYLLITLFTFGVGAVALAIIGIIDAIKFLSMSDDDFQEYCEQKIAARKEKSHTNNPRSGKNEHSSVARTDNANINDSLKKLKELYDIGALSEPEYLRLKNDVLGGWHDK